MTLPALVIDPFCSSQQRLRISRMPTELPGHHAGSHTLDDMRPTTPTPIDRSVDLVWRSLAPADVLVQRPGRVNRVTIDDSAFLNSASSYLGDTQPDIRTASGDLFHVKKPSSVDLGLGKHSPVWGMLAVSIRAMSPAIWQWVSSCRLRAVSATYCYRWIKPDGSFKLGALTLGIVEVERRVFGTAGKDSNANFWPVAPDYAVVPLLVLDSLTAGVVDPGTLDEHFIRTLRAMAASHGWDPDALPTIERAVNESGRVVGSTAEILRAAVIESFVRTRALMLTGIAISGVVSVTRRRWCWVVTETARTALTIHRAYVLRRCAAIAPPGRIVTASARVCRGPNLADDSLNSNRLRGIYIRH